MGDISDTISKVFTSTVLFEPYIKHDSFIDCDGFLWIYSFYILLIYFLKSLAAISIPLPPSTQHGRAGFYSKNMSPKKNKIKNMYKCSECRNVTAHQKHYSQLQCSSRPLHSLPKEEMLQRQMDLMLSYVLIYVVIKPVKALLICTLHVRASERCNINRRTPAVKQNPVAQ